MSITFKFDEEDWVWLVDGDGVRQLASVGGLRKMLGQKEYLILYMEGKNQREEWVGEDKLTRANVVST